MKKITFFLCGLLMLCMSVTLVSCSDDDDDVSAESFVGKVFSATAFTITAKGETNPIDMPVSIGFTGLGVGVFKFGEEPSVMTWAFNSDSNVMAINVDGEIDLLIYSDSTQTLTLTRHEDAGEIAPETDFVCILTRTL